MKFTKMHGAGNDFIILNNFEEKIPEEKLSALARRLCTPRLSIGADGLMATDKPEQGGDYKMHFYNADGTKGEMCGNGARCIARYGYERGLAGEIQHIETTAGMVTGWRISQRQYKIRLNDPTVVKLNYDVTDKGVRYDCSYVELGNPGLPHAVVRFDKLDTIDDDSLRDIARRLRWHEAFPKGANVNFYKILGDDTVLARTFERGVEDFTLACGTGAGSTALVLTLKKKASGQNVCIKMPGGDLLISLTRASDGQVQDLFLTGPTNIVAEGEVLDEDLVF